MGAQQLRAQIEMGSPDLAPALGLQSLSIPTFKKGTATVLQVCVLSGPACRQARGAELHGAMSVSPRSIAFSFRLLRGNKEKWFMG